MNDAPTVHVVMGMEEATVIATGLGLLLAHLDHDIDSETGENIDAMFEMLSTKLLATNMFTSLWETMGVPRDDIEALLDRIEERND